MNSFISEFGGNIEVLPKETFFFLKNTFHINSSSAKSLLRSGFRDVHNKEIPATIFHLDPPTASLSPKVLHGPGDREFPQ